MPEGRALVGMQGPFLRLASPAVNCHSCSIRHFTAPELPHTVMPFLPTLPCLAPRLVAVIQQTLKAWVGTGALR